MSYMVIISQAWEGFTPDKLVIVPVETEEEVEELWDYHEEHHDHVAGVYREGVGGVFVHDARWGTMGKRRGSSPSMGFIRNENGGRPPGWRSIELGDLLSPEMFKKIEPTMKKIGSGEMDQIAGQKKILELLQPIKEELLAKGVLDEYLAYFLTYLATQLWGKP